MKRCRKSTVVIASQSLILAVSVAFLAWSRWENWFVKNEAMQLASQVGFERARSDFVRGRVKLLELQAFKLNPDSSVPTEGAVVDTGRFDRTFRVWSLLMNEDFPIPGAHREIQQTLVNAYNQHMHQLVEKPEWFDTNGFRAPAHRKSPSAVKSER